MALSLGQFGAKMGTAAKGLPSAVNVVVRAMCEEIHRELVVQTPVDEGVARSNWVVSLSTPFGDFIEAYAPGERLGKGERANAFAAIIQGRGEIALRQPGQTVYIQNNAPYIGILNDGYSSQSPALFVETAIISGIRILDGKELKLI